MYGEYTFTIIDTHISGSVTSLEAQFCLFTNTNTNTALLYLH